MGKYNIARLLHSGRYRKTKRKKRIAKKLKKIYWEYCTDSTGRLRKMEKIRIFRKTSKLDCKAVDIAKKIHYAPYFSSEKKGTVKAITFSLWGKFKDDGDCQEIKALLSAIRKAIVDDFPIENTYLYEIPLADDEMLIVYFVNKDDYDDYHWYKKNVDIRSICFCCYYDRLFAQPAKEVDEIIYEVKTCQEAISVID